MERQKGDVVLLVSALPYEGVELLKECFLQRSFIITVLGNECLQHGKPNISPLES